MLVPMMEWCDLAVADNITDGVVNTTLQADEHVNNVTLSQKSNTSKGHPTFLRGTNVTQAQVISTDEAFLIRIMPRLL
jgi:hypothetical protein